MSELTHHQFSKSINRVRMYLNWSLQREGRGARTHIAYAIYAAMGGNTDDVSYQKVYATLKKAGLVWVPSKGEWCYTNVYRFWMSIEPLYRPHWAVNGTVHLFSRMFYVDSLPVDLQKWMSE